MSYKIVDGRKTNDGAALTAKKPLARLAAAFLSVCMLLASVFAFLPVSQLSVTADPDSIASIQSVAAPQGWQNSATAPKRIDPVDSTDYGKAAAYWQTNGDSRYSTTVGLGDSKDNPYIIKTGYELADLATQVNSGFETSGKFFRLDGTKVGDEYVIDLIGTGVLIYASGGLFPVACDSAGTNFKGWTPIGTSSKPFKGTFYGNTENNPTIINLSGYYNGSAITIPDIGSVTPGLCSGNYYGLFGYTSGATFENIHLKQVQMVSYQSGSVMGSLVAYATGGLAVTDCSAEGLDYAMETQNATATGEDIYKRTISVTETENNSSSTIDYYVPDMALRCSGGNSCIGGLIGKVNEGTLTVSNCSAMKGTVMHSSTVNTGNTPGTVLGGVVANCTSTTATISGITGFADLSSAPSKDHYVIRTGGVIGFVSGGTVTVSGVGESKEKPFRTLIRGRIQGVTETNDAYSGSTYNGGVGGIVGAATASSALTIGKDSAGNAASCYVETTASVSGKDPGNNGLMLGGVLGRWGWNGGGSGVLTISNCTVTGLTLTPSSPLSGTSVYGLRATSVGGILGAVDGCVQYYANNKIENCEVLSATVCADGLVGGIVGLGKGASVTNTTNGSLGSITSCTVGNFTIYQTSASKYPSFGGIAVFGGGTKISACNVSGFVVYALATSVANTLEKASIGGICGSSMGNTTISDCTADITVRVSSYQTTTGTSGGGFAIGGIVGSLLNSALKNCAAKVDFAPIASYGSASSPDGYGYAYKIDYVYTNKWFTLTAGETVAAADTQKQSFTQAVSGSKMGAVVAGGLVGQLFGNGSGTGVSDCSATGNIDFDAPYKTSGTDAVSAVSGSLGGLIGRVTNINSGSWTVNNCYSSVSLSGELRDTIGGLVGYTDFSGLNLTNCRFGGILTDAHAASLVAYAPNGITCQNLSYNSVGSPNAASADGKVTGTADTTAFTVPTGLSDSVKSYFTLATAAETALSGTFSGENVFACTALPGGGDTAAYEIATITTTSGSLSVDRKVKYILKRDGVDTSDGKTFTVSDLSAMQAYVAAGGGFLGSSFKLSSDQTISETWSPIGTAGSSSLTWTFDDGQPFCGTFDGDGKTITVPASADLGDGVFGGVFGYARHAEITKFNVSYAGAATVKGVRAGGVIAAADFSTIFSINLTFAGNISFTSENAEAGGIVGYADACTLSTLTVTGDSEAAELIPAKNCNFGGIAGVIDSSFSTVTNSSCTAKITGAGGKRNYLGGIAARTLNNDTVFTFANTGALVNGATSGDVLASVAVPEPKFSSCYYVGDLGLASSFHSCNVGGIVGYADASDKLIDKCFAFANVTGSEKVGGLIGYSADGESLLITDSYFVGRVGTQNQDDKLMVYAGGIIGFIGNESTTAEIVDNVYFVGQIVGLNVNKSNASQPVVGALTASKANPSKANGTGFFYDYQVAGNIPVTASVEDDSTAEKITSAMSENGLYTTVLTNAFFKDNAWDTLARTVSYNFSSATSATISTATTFGAGDALTETDERNTFAHSALPTGIGYTASTYSFTAACNGGTFTVTRTVTNGYALAVEEVVRVMPSKSETLPALEGEGTQSNPFKITNVAELKIFRNYINKVYGGAGLYFKLEPAAGYVFDLDKTDEAGVAESEWTPIGTATSPFQGTLIGNGSTISDMKITALSNSAAGLFGYTAGANIGGIVLENSSIAVSDTLTATSYIGGLIGRAVNTTLSDCTSECTITATANTSNVVSVGAAVGYMAGNCSVSGVLGLGDVTVHGYAGNATNHTTGFRVGLIGSVWGDLASYSTTISDCMAYGNYTAASITNSFLYFGGIVGFAQNSSGIPSLEISACAFYGGMDCTAVSNTYSGGIIGRCAHNLTMKDGVSTASLRYISEQKATFCIGGILGDLDGSAKLNEFSDNGFYGEINSASASNDYHVGGLIGWSSGKASTVTAAAAANVFDGTKNPGLKALGYENSGDGTTTATIGEENGQIYPYTSYTKTSGFGSEAMRLEAETIARGQSVILYMVRVDDAKKSYSAENAYMRLTSVYTLATFSESVAVGVTMSDGGDRVYAALAAGTAGSDSAVYRRIASTANGFPAAVGASVALTYGKSLTYYTSVETVGKRDISPYLLGEADNASGIFAVYNADQLMGLDSLLLSSAEDGFGNYIALKPSGNYTVSLQDDIDFSVWSAAGITAPIGDSSNAFSATLDGNHHAIYNIAFLDTNGADVNSLNFGLFDTLSGATIKNVGITDSAYLFVDTSKVNSGSFAAVVSGNTKFTDVFSSAVIQCKANKQNINMGGFVGSVSGGTLAVENSFFTGSVGVYNNATISDKSGWYLGGFVGEVAASSAVSFSNSYVSSYLDCSDNVTYNRYSGLFVGYKADGATVEFVSSSADFNAAAENAMAIGNSTVTPLSSLTATNGLYPVPAGSGWGDEGVSSRSVTARVAVEYVASAASTNTATLSYATAAFDTTARNGVAAIGGNSLYLLSKDAETGNPILTRNNSGLGSVYVVYGDSARLVVFNLRSWYDEYETEDEKRVYTIKTFAEFNEFAGLVNGTVTPSTLVNDLIDDDAASGFANCIIRLGDDLVGAGALITTVGDGTQTHIFNGVFDGSGYSISDFAVSNDGKAYAGVFYSLGESASVSNLLLSGTVTFDLTGSASVYAGGIVGDYSAGTVSNCYNGARITVNNNLDGTFDVYFGGIAGHVAAGKALTYCYNMGRIIAGTEKDAYLGGIVGKNDGTVQYCYNTGIIEGYYNPSDSTQRYTHIAGITPANGGTVSDCYNAAVLRYGKTQHPIAINGEKGNTTVCFVDKQFLYDDYTATDGDGVTLLTTAEMCGGSAIGLSGDWTYTAGYYPQFSCNKASGTAESLTGAQQMSLVSALAPQLYNEGEATFEAFTYINFVYGTDFAFDISQSTSYVGRFGVSEFSDGSGQRWTVTKKGAAMLTYSYGGFSREGYFINEESIEVRYLFDFSQLISSETTGEDGTVTTSSRATARPDGRYTALDGTKSVVEADTDAFMESGYGNGTASYPYIINTPADLIEFAKYVNDGGATAGRYFRLVRNIDMGGQTFTPIGNAANPFKGNFSGNGYTVSGLTMTSASAYTGLFGNAAAGSVIQLVALTDSTFTVTATGVSYAGAIVGKTAGVVVNVWTNARIVQSSVPSTGSEAYAGGLVGYIDVGGVLRSAYVRNNKSGSGGTLISSIGAGNAAYVAGVLAGYNAGIIRGCYHTAVCETASAEYKKPCALVGICATESAIPRDCFYNGGASFESLYLIGGRAVACRGSEDVFAATETELKQKESEASDGIVLRLSGGMYLGAFSLTTYDDKNTNDGFPMLAAFDLLQYEFTDFDTESLILCLKNTASTQEKMMNAICDYGLYDFPSYTEIVMLDQLKIDVYSLPKGLTYNISVVAYGADENGNDVKWTVLNGLYTSSHGLTQGGNDLISNTQNGGTTITFAQAGVMPENLYKIYIYVTLVPGTASADWGVNHEWNSANDQPFPSDDTTGN